MKTTISEISIKDTTFKTDAIKRAVEIMLENDYTVLINPDQTKLKSGISYAIFSKDDKIGYCQAGEFGHGVTFGTVHKGNRNCGTGFGLQSWDEAIDEPTLKDIEQAFIFAPNWAQEKDRAAVVKYKNLDDYFSVPVNTIVKKAKLTT